MKLAQTTDIRQAKRTEMEDHGVHLAEAGLDPEGMILKASRITSLPSYTILHTTHLCQILWTRTRQITSTFRITHDPTELLPG